MQCPVCVTVELRVADRQSVEIDYCPKCRGVWLDRGELDKLIERSSVAYTPVDERQYTAPEKAKRGEALDLDLEDSNLFGRRRVEESERYRRDDYRRDDDDDTRYRDERNQSKKKKGFLGEIFDIFD